MVSQKVKVKNPSGLHLRPAGLFTKTMSQFESEVFVCKNGNEINAKSVLHVLASGINCGDVVEVRCDGPDEREALDRAVDFIENEMNEETV
ncbi:MAG: HPr family phosphocarrier protein [Butyrivibrio sp.]|nr:HPr family phosphocarrier protein [Butyrivibrio sp.]